MHYKEDVAITLARRRQF